MRSDKNKIKKRVKVCPNFRPHWGFVADYAGTEEILAVMVNQYGIQVDIKIPREILKARLLRKGKY